MEETVDPYINKELLGEILIKRGLLKAEQLKEALDIQEQEGGRLGEILLNLGYIDEIDIVVALIVQCSFPYIAIEKYKLNKKVLELIPEDIAREFYVIPLDLVGNVLSVVMADPLDRSICAKLEQIANCKIATFISTKSEIETAIDKYYGRKK